MIRTGYSFRTAVGKVDEVASRLQEIGWDVLPIADQCSTFGFVEATDRSKAIGLRPVYGVRLAVVPELGTKRPIVDNWTFLAVNDLRSLHDLIGLATSNPGKEPSITYEQALGAEGLHMISGERVLLSRVKNPGKNFYVGLAPSTPKMVIAEARKRKFRFLAHQDNLYPRAEDKEFYRVAVGYGATTQTYPLWIVSDDEWLASIDADDATKKEAMRHRNAVLYSCVAELVKGEVFVPDKPKTLRQMCQDGAERVGIDLETNKIYSRRLDHELDMIQSKNFEDYFYVLADLIGWAKKKMIVGPARGSSCGSLVCYLLDITTIDPIEHGLMFERFIDESRNDLPDVDVDFSDARRHLVFEYAEEKFGRDHVARLGNVNSFQAKSALNKIAVSLRIPEWRIDRVTASIVHRAMGDSRAAQTIEDTLDQTDVGKALVEEFPEIRIVTRFEDHPAAASQHAAGVILTKRPVADHVAVDRRTGAIMADKKDAEALNLLKIDALGLTQLSIFERTLELIGRPSVSGWLETLPLDDAEAFQVLNKKKFSGIFQFVGHAVQSLSNALLRHGTFDKFDDLVALTALARPGPMGSGGSDDWIRRRTGQKLVTHLHPLFEPYTRNTYGIIVYQEQTMAIGRDIGDLSWEEVNQLRRAMSHSYGREFFDQFGDKWKAGAIAKGMDQAIADKVWGDLCQFGSMAFNLSHSVAYGMVSYYCCYLKAHYPVEFAAATLDAQGDPATQIDMLRELRTEGVDYLPVDIEVSTDRWQPLERDGKKFLVGPLSAIKGIGQATVNTILEARRTGTELKPGLMRRLAAAKTSISSLYPVRDSVERIAGGGDLSTLNIVSPRSDIHDLALKGDEANDSEAMIIGVVVRIDPTDENSLVRLQKRQGRRVSGPSMALHMYVKDDSGEMFCKVHRLDFDRIGREIAERGKAGKAIYAMKGRLYANPEFTMLWVKQVKYIGELSDG